MPETFPKRLTLPPVRPIRAELADPPARLNVVRMVQTALRIGVGLLSAAALLFAIAVALAAANPRPAAEPRTIDFARLTSPRREIRFTRPEDWRTFVPPGTAYSVQMPGTPRRHSNPEVDHLGAKYVVADGLGNTFAAASYDVPGLSPTAQTLATFADGDKEALWDGAGRTVSQRDIRIGAAPGREWVGESPDRAQRCSIRWYIAPIPGGARVTLVMYGGEAARLQESARHQFFGSLRLVDAQPSR